MTQVVIVDEEVSGKVKEAVAKMIGVTPDKVEMLTVIPRGMPRRLIASRFGVNPGCLSQSPTVGGLIEAVKKQMEPKPTWLERTRRAARAAESDHLADLAGLFDNLDTVEPTAATA